jgi:DNA-binding LacI/PurR family transcriptional regulator
MIGYLVSEPNYEPSWKSIMGALSEAETLGYTLQVLAVNRDTLKERVRQCVELRLGGIIASIIGGHKVVFEEAAHARIPVSIMEGVAQPFGANVIADDAVGLNEAIAHLKALGHTRIGFLSSGFPRFSGRGDIGTARQELFVRLMNEHGLPVSESSIAFDAMAVFGPHVESEANIRSAMEATQSLLSQSERPTAICCWRDETAMIAIRACEESGLRVPDDISVVGFSDLNVSRFFRPPLSTVRSPWDALGRLAVRQLCQRMDEEFSLEPTTHLVPTTFIPRASSGLAPR